MASRDEAKHNDGQFLKKNAVADSQISDQMKNSTMNLPIISTGSKEAIDSQKKQSADAKSIDNQNLQKSREGRPISPGKPGSVDEGNSGKRSNKQHEGRVLTERIN